MLCPFCQHELDVDSLSCPRCHAAYPHPAKPLGFSLRLVAVAASMMLVISVILVDCVINYLPGGPRSSIPVGSAQLPIQPLPNMKSSDVNAMMQNWSQGQQEGRTAIAVPKK